MVIQQVDYYFAEQCVKDAFDECIAFLFDELMMNEAMNLSNNVKSHELNEQLEEYSDSDVFVDCSNLKETIESIFEAFDVKIESVLLYDSEIKNRIKDLEQDLIQNSDIEFQKRSITIYCDKNGRKELLFFVHYARHLSLELSDEFDLDSKIIHYEDFDYSELESYIDDYFAESKIIKSYILDHYDSDENTFDIYYKISRIPDFF